MMLIVFYEGKKQRNRNKKRALVEEYKGLESEESRFSGQEVQNIWPAERRLKREGIHPVRKVLIVTMFELFIEIHLRTLR